MGEQAPGCDGRRRPLPGPAAGPRQPARGAPHRAGASPASGAFASRCDGAR
jgi:hypothetical protein